MKNQTTIRPFRNRAQAGEELACAVMETYRYRNVVVFGLPRGGVITAAPVARKLHAPLLPVYVRKLGHPLYEEYAIGAVGEDGQATYNLDEIHGLYEEWLQATVEKARADNKVRRELYNHVIPNVAIRNDTVAMIIDDGIATGLSMETAIRSTKALRPAEVVVAVPVAPLDAVARLSRMVDKIFLLENPDNYLGSVGAHYEEFTQVTDNTVIMSLRSTNRSRLRRLRNNVHNS